MPRSLPKRYEFKVFVTEDVIAQIDEIVRDEEYNGRGDYALTLIRQDLADRKRAKLIEQEFALMEDRNHKKQK